MSSLTEKKKKLEEEYAALTATLERLSDCPLSFHIARGSTLNAIKSGVELNPTERPTGKAKSMDELCYGDWWKKEYKYGYADPTLKITQFCDTDFAKALPKSIRKLITNPLKFKGEWEVKIRFVNCDIKDLIRRDTFNSRETYEACGIDDYFNEEEGEVWVMFGIEQESCIHKYYWDFNDGRKYEVCGEEDEYYFGNNDITDDRLVGFDKYGEFINRPNISPYFPISNLYYNR